MTAEQIRLSFTSRLKELAFSDLLMSEYRHGTEEFVDKHFFSITTQVHSAFAAQRGHSMATCSSTYGLTNEDLLQVSAATLDIMWHCSNKWHQLLGIAKETKRKSLIVVLYYPKKQIAFEREQSAAYNDVVGSLDTCFDKVTVSLPSEVDIDNGFDFDNHGESGSGISKVHNNQGKKVL